jgi:hypothetical protein
LTSCVSCDPNITPALYLSGTSCGTTCPDYYYPDSITHTCIVCSIPCKTCTSVNNCITCATGYSLYGLSCILACPSAYISIAQVCLTCTSPCLTCTPTQTTCTSCVTSLSPSVYLTSSYTCVIAANCPTQTYADTSNYKCVACVSPCLTCSTAVICLSCVTGTSFYINKCLSSCPTGYASVSSICTACTSPCLTCSGSITSCLSCDPSVSPSVYLAGSSCLTNCPSTTFSNFLDQTCTACISPCSTCSSTTICISCASGYSFYSNYCYTNCPSGLVSINQVCLVCSTPCLTCQSTQTSC